MADAGHSERETFFSAAKMMAAVTMLSRVLGLIRDVVLVPIGNRVLADRFWVAFAIPNFFRRLFGEGAMSAAFVPVFTEVTETEGWDRARVVFANVSALLATALTGLMTLVLAGLWIAWATMGGDDWLRLFLFQLVTLMMPYMVLICLLALTAAAMNCRGHFAYPAFAPVLGNVVLIAGGLLATRLAIPDHGKFFVIGGAVLAAGVVQLAIAAALLRRWTMLAKPTLRPVLPETRRIGRLMGPMVVPLAVLQISALADQIIALWFTKSPGVGAGGEPLLAAGVPTCLYAANRIFQLPLGVLAVSVATAIFPLFSRYASRKDTDGLRDTTNRALRLGLFLGIPAGVALIVLAEPAVAVIFERRQFSVADTLRTSAMLQMYCIGMWAYFCNQILLRAFYAIQRPRVPMITACSLVGLNLVLVLVGIHTPLRGAAIGLATATTAMLQTALLVWFLRRQWGQLGARRIAVSLARILVATAVMAAGTWAGMRYMRSPLTDALGSAGRGRMASLAVSIAAGIALYAAAARALRCPELPELLRRKGKAS